LREVVLLLVIVALLSVFLQLTARAVAAARCAGGVVAGTELLQLSTDTNLYPH